MRRRPSTPGAGRCLIRPPASPSGCSDASSSLRLPLIRKARCRGIRAEGAVLEGDAALDRADNARWQRSAGSCDDEMRDRCDGAAEAPGASVHPSGDVTAAHQLCNCNRSSADPCRRSLPVESCITLEHRTLGTDPRTGLPMSGHRRTGRRIEQPDGEQAPNKHRPAPGATGAGAISLATRCGHGITQHAFAGCAGPTSPLWAGAQCEGLRSGRNFLFSPCESRQEILTAAARRTRSSCCWTRLRHAKALLLR